MKRFVCLIVFSVKFNVKIRGWDGSGSRPAVCRWLSKQKDALWHLICPSSRCVRGPGRLPVLMHCSITKIPVCRVGEARRGRGRLHTRPLTALNIAGKRLLQPPGPHITWQRAWMSRPHSAERQTQTNEELKEQKHCSVQQTSTESDQQPRLHSLPSDVSGQIWFISPWNVESLVTFSVLWLSIKV